MLGGVTSLIVKVVVQVEVFPAASCAVIVIVWAPVPLNEVPASGLCVKVIDAATVQLSVAAAAPVKLGTSAAQLASPFALCPGGHVVMLGGVVSFTVNVVVHVEVFPAASCAVIVTVVGPRPTSVPAVGLCVKVIEPGAVQLSVAAAEPVRSGT